MFEAILAGIGAAVLAVVIVYVAVAIVTVVRWH